MFNHVTRNICTSQNLLTKEVTDVSYEEVKAALKDHFEEKT